jgi:hypothetical protein
MRHSGLPDDRDILGFMLNVEPYVLYGQVVVLDVLGGMEMFSKTVKLEAVWQP